MLVRLMEVFVLLNAVGGVLTFLGFRYAGRKIRARILGQTPDPIAPESKDDDVAVRR